GPQVRVLSGALPRNARGSALSRPRAFAFEAQVRRREHAARISGILRSRGKSHLPQPPLERLASRAAHSQTCSPLQLHLVVASLAPQERLHEVEAHDGGAVNPHETIGIESLLQLLHRFADDVTLTSDVELRIGSTRGDEIDGADGNHPHPALHLDGDPLEVTRGRSARWL